MKTKISTLFAFVLCIFSLNASAIKLSKDATISILTCAPGNDFTPSSGTRDPLNRTRRTVW